MVAAGRHQLPMGTAGPRYHWLSPCLLVPDGHHQEIPALLLAHWPVPELMDASLGGLHKERLVWADPTWAYQTLAVGWDTPTNTDQEIWSWFCCSRCSQAVRDNRKR